MKCEFEHNGGCCNSESPQFMFRCKPDVCHSAVPMTNGDRIRSMNEMRLIDANQFEAFAIDPPDGYSEEQLEAYHAGATLVLEKIDAAQAINQEELPVVLNLRAALANVTAQRNAAARD